MACAVEDDARNIWAFGVGAVHRGRPDQRVVRDWLGGQDDQGLGALKRGMRGDARGACRHSAFPRSAGGRPAGERIEDSLIAVVNH